MLNVLFLAQGLKKKNAWMIDCSKRIEIKYNEMRKGYMFKDQEESWAFLCISANLANSTEDTFSPKFYIV